MKMMMTMCYQDQALIIMRILKLALKIPRKMKITNILDHQSNDFNNKKTQMKSQ